MTHMFCLKLVLLPLLCFSLCNASSRLNSDIYRDDGLPVLGKSDFKFTQLADETDRFTFPGAPSHATFNTYGGYVTVDADAGRALYYVLVEAEVPPSGVGAADETPVVLWLNGGPGCSSLGGGLMSELGPYYPTADGENLTLNKHRWNRIAHMVFLESPAFVGFSYSNTSSDQEVGDVRTAQDGVAFLTGFFERYPELASNPFWISGESYGGHYVPNLALAVHKHNEDRKNKRINLQGFLVGNAWTDAATDNEGAVDFWWAHAIVSDAARDGVKANCNFSTVGPLASSPLCDEAVMLSMRNMGPINIYDIYAPVCLASRARHSAAALGHQLQDASAAGGIAARVAMLQQISGKYDACIDDEVAVYLNRPEVQEAMHANVSGTIPGPWQDCTRLVKYSRADLLSSMLPVYHELLQTDLKMLVFSGDVDAIVPVIGTRRWIAKLGLSIKEAWRPWHTSSQQVGGYVEVYEGLVFATVREAGHMVPYTQPARGFHLFESFITGQPL